METVQLLSFIALVTNLLLGVTVVFASRRSWASWVFFAVTVFTSAWAVTNYLTENASDVALSNLYNRLAFLMAFLAVLSVAAFTYLFPYSHVQRVRQYLDLIVGSVGIVSILSLTDLVAGYVTTNELGQYTFHFGVLAPFYGAVILVLLVFIVRNLVITIRSGNPREKQQSYLLLFGFTATISLGLLTNLVIPYFVSNWTSAKLGPVLSLILVGTITYAMVKHGLFDFRTFVVRSLGYVTLLSVFALLYGLVVFGVVQGALHESIPFSVQVLISIITALASLVFPLLKRVFDNFTNSLFHKYLYNPQELLDTLNDQIAGETDVSRIGFAVVGVLANELKAEKATLVLSNGRAIASSGTEPRSSSYHPLEKLLADNKDVVVNLDKIAGNPNRHALVEEMRSAGVTVIAEMRDAEQVLARIYISPKLSGAPYTNQDLLVIKIIADQVALAVQNALKFEEIERFNETLQDKVTAATRKLQKTNEKLVQLDETKDEFISMASHQLRTPLTSIKGYLSMVLEGDAGDISPSQRKMLDQAFVSSQRMVALIADLLNVSRLRTGKFVIEPSMTNLADVVKGEVAQLKETAAGRHLELTFEAPSSFPQLYMDETKTRQVIMNFIDNAIYYTPAGGHIHVKLADSAKTIEFTVSDDGIGVPKSEQFHLFTKFYRAGNARKARPDGTGLGLFMAKKVIVAQGGAVLFKSRPGKGSTFGFTFAKNKLQPPAAPQA